MHGDDILNRPVFYASKISHASFVCGIRVSYVSAIHRRTFKTTASLFDDPVSIVKETGSQGPQVNSSVMWMTLLTTCRVQISNENT
jgi:hypothetical protein